MTTNKTHNECLVARHLADEQHLKQERALLPTLLDDDEELLSVASAGYGFGRPGILAVTDQRLLYVSCGWLGRRCKSREVAYSQIERVEVITAWSSSEVRFHLKKKRRAMAVSIMADAETGRAAQIASCARDAMKSHASRPGPR